MVTFQNTPQDASLRAQYDAERNKRREKWYFAIRNFMRDTEDIAMARKWLDAYIAEYGNTQYSAWLQETLNQIVSYANERAGYNADGTPKLKLVSGSVTYTVEFSDKFYGDNRVNLLAERSVTYTDILSGKTWHWQAIAWLDRNSEHDFTGRIYRHCYLNGVSYQDSIFNFGRVSNPLLNVYSDPMHTVDSFLTHAEFLTRQMNKP